MVRKKSSKTNKVETKYSFKVRLWKFTGPAGWCFATLPKVISRKIRKTHLSSEEGWGRLKTSATVGATTWKTAIWFDTKHDSYLLPVKTLIRKKENLEIGDLVSINIEFEPADWSMNLLIWR